VFGQDRKGKPYRVEKAKRNRVVSFEAEKVCVLSFCVDVNVGINQQSADVDISILGREVQGGFITSFQNEIRLYF
jgi:hypothetical protein